MSPEPLGYHGDSAGPSKLVNNDILPFYTRQEFQYILYSNKFFQAKRERKSKFNVREVLNLKEASPKVGIQKTFLVPHSSSVAGDGQHEGGALVQKLSSLETNFLLSAQAVENGD